MSWRNVEAPHYGALDQIRALAVPLRDSGDLEHLADHVGTRRFVCIGEASHGTHEFYSWRAALSQRLIEEEGFTWIGVEGDWPDCWRINRWVRALADADLDARGILVRFERWPTWMWANEEVADFLTWLRAWNLEHAPEEGVGFYGLDVYSLWDSLRQIISWLEENAPDSLEAALEAWRCFAPYNEDPHAYAWSTRIVPEGCEDDVVKLLVEIRRQTIGEETDPEAAFDARQNAAVAAEAEHYYRIMVQGSPESWNVRDRHMVDTVDRIATHLGPQSKGVLWEHNTHIGDARGTDMAASGMLNVGQLMRERRGVGNVALIGFASHRGSVMAGESWGAPERVMQVPEAVADSHEDLLHRALGAPGVLEFGDDRSGPWLSARLGHRAIGVVYDPRLEQRGNYVPTTMGERYDALIWIEEARALRPLHHEGPPLEPEYETEPTGF